MAVKLSLHFPNDWKISYDTYIEEDGSESAHAEAIKGEEASIEVFVGNMPEDNDAPDQALANYVEMVGFDKDDPEDFNPIMIWPFDKKKAYGFEALCEDDSPMRFISLEMKSGVLAILCVAAISDEKLDEFVALAERGLRV